MPPLQVKFDRPLKNVAVCSAEEAAALREQSRQTAAAASSAKTESRLKNLLTEIVESVQELSVQRLDQREQLKTTAVQLAVMIVKHLVGGAELLNSHRLQDVVNEALERSESPTRLRLHPRDHELLKSFLDTAGQSGDPLAAVADESIEMGECRIEYPGFELTSSLTQQLAEMEHRLLEAIHVA